MLLERHFKIFAVKIRLKTIKKEKIWWRGRNGRLLNVRDGGHRPGPDGLTPRLIRKGAKRVGGTVEEGHPINAARIAYSITQWYTYDQRPSHVLLDSLGPGEYQYSIGQIHLPRRYLQGQNACYFLHFQSRYGWKRLVDQLYTIAGCCRVDFFQLRNSKSPRSLRHHKNHQGYQT